MSKSLWALQRRRRLVGWSGDDSSGNWSTPSRPSGTDRSRSSGSAVGLLGWIVADLSTSFAWAWGMHLAYAASGDRPGPKTAVYVAGRFFCAWVTEHTGGGSTNPLTALTSTSSAAGGCYGVLVTGLFRVPAQVAGNTMGILLFSNAFPGYEPGTFLEVDIFMGAAVQGILAFTMAVVNLSTARVSIFQQTFVSTMTRIVLNQLGTGLTNGWLNPASAFGWAYLSGTHSTKEHMVVYWIAPVLATLLGVQLYDSFVQREGSGNWWKSD